LILYKYSSILFILGLIFNTLLGCSSSSSSMRYNENDEKKVIESKNDVRYDHTNITTVKDTLAVADDEDVTEYQDPSDLPDDESSIDLSALMKSLENKSAESDAELISASQKELMLMEIIKYMNTPYKFGGNSLNGIDCSAFTQNVYRDSWSIEINRSARQQYLQGIPIEDRSELKFGDLVFFNTRRRVKPGHVGIYIGDNLFAHASSSSGVKISSLDHVYYNNRYMGARRFDEDLFVH